MKIIGISGKKQAGKNTVANYINGDVLKDRGMIEDFYINNHGELAIKTSDTSGQSGYGIFDPTRKDPTFIEYAETALWPYIKIYHFADPLKELAINIFGLKSEEVYGNDEQKNKIIEIMWEHMPENNTNKTGRMTNREFLEHFGTKIVRKIKNDAWYERTMKIILTEKSELAIIPDVRFPNEVEAIKSAGGFVIRLTRNIYNSPTEAECALDEENFDYKKFDMIIDNHNVTIDQLCNILSLSKRYWS